MRRMVWSAIWLVGGIAFAAPASAQKTAFDPSAPSADPKLKVEAEALARKVWSGVLRTCGEVAVEGVDGRIFVELDHPSFTLAAMRQPDAAAQSGYQFRGVAMASAKRWRWALRTSGAPRWSEWRLGAPTVVRDDNLTLDRGSTTVDDVVLKFDIVKKDDAWSANYPISSLNYAIKPLDLEKVSISPSTPSCRQAGSA